jgi:hypothetical protein
MLHVNAANCTESEIKRTPDRTPTDAPDSGLSFVPILALVSDLASVAPSMLENPG